MALFDEVIGNTDRHDGNWLEDENRKLWAIDHGLTFDPIWLESDPDLAGAQLKGRFVGVSRAEMTWEQQNVLVDETLTRWSGVSREEIERVMTECNKRGEGGLIYDRIQKLHSEIQGISERARKRRS